MLTAKEFEIQEFFLANKEQILTKESVFQQIWGSAVMLIEENTLSVTNSRLKKELGTEQHSTISER